MARAGLGQGCTGPPLTCCCPTQEWREKALFANLLEPVLRRERWGWDRRHQDFNLYTRPPEFLELPPAPKPRAGESGASAPAGPADCRPGSGWYTPLHSAPAFSAVRGHDCLQRPPGTLSDPATHPFKGKGHDDPSVSLLPSCT